MMKLEVDKVIISPPLSPYLPSDQKAGRIMMSSCCEEVTLPFAMRPSRKEQHLAKPRKLRQDACRPGVSISSGTEPTIT